MCSLIVYPIAFILSCRLAATFTFLTPPGQPTDELASAPQTQMHAAFSQDLRRRDVCHRAVDTGKVFTVSPHCRTYSVRYCEKQAYNGYSLD